MDKCPYGYFSYIIGVKDTYSSIAKKYWMPEQTLREFNKNEQLLPGCKVKIPYICGGCSNGAFYTIKSGETLSDIAKRSGLDLKQLLTANPYLNPNYYVAGQVIVIPQHSVSETTFVYTVRPREGIFNILRKFDMDLNTFCLLNSDADPEKLVPGQRIIVLEQRCSRPGKWYEIEKADNPASIAEKFGVMLAELFSVNQNLRPSDFLEGVIIRIPD